MPQHSFMNIAHRGASSYAPENTFSAFDRALELGIDQVELDVHSSRDGQIVVIHDDLELTKGTPGKAPEGPDPAGVYLQGHGNPVVFRNIWVILKK